MGIVFKMRILVTLTFEFYQNLPFPKRIYIMYEETEPFVMYLTETKSLSLDQRSEWRHYTP